MGDDGVVVGVGLNVGVGLSVGDGVALGEGVKVGVGLLVGISGIGVFVGVAERIAIISARMVIISPAARRRSRANPALKEMIRATTTKIPMKIRVDKRALSCSISSAQ